MGEETVRDREDVIAFWFDEIGEKNWFFAGDAIDEKIRAFALETYTHIYAEGKDCPWLSSTKGALAYILMLDQFPRNMFRDTARAFQSDGLARDATMLSIAKGWDMAHPEKGRSFFYLPLMHSENLSDQALCIEKFKNNMPKNGANSLTHAYAHFETIRRYGRFPMRNKALGRTSTPAERDFIERNLYADFLDAITNAKDPSAVL